MHLLNQQKLFFLLILSTITISGPLHCMGDQRIDPAKLSYFPTQAPDDTELMATRSLLKLTTSQNIQQVCPDIDILKIEKPWQRKGVCFRVAIKESFGLTKKEMASIPILWCEDLTGSELNILNDYYEQTNYPHAGTLAVYYNSARKCSIEHFGTVMLNGKIRSKFGTGKGIYAHPLWMLQAGWGNSVIFLNIKQKFTGEKGKQIFLTELKEKAKTAFAIQSRLAEMQKDFIDGCKYNLPCISLYDIIKLSPTIAIDEPDALGNTPLMYAVEKGNLDAVQLLINHRVNLDVRNKKGETALMLATDNKHSHVALVLRIEGSLAHYKKNNKK